MKNTIVIEVDDEKDSPVTINKPSEESKPNNNKEAAEMIKGDVETVAEGMMQLFKLAENIDVSTEDRNVEYIIDHLLATYPDNENLKFFKDILNENYMKSNRARSLNRRMYHRNKNKSIKVRKK